MRNAIIPIIKPTIEDFFESLFKPEIPKNIAMIANTNAIKKRGDTVTEPDINEIIPKIIAHTALGLFSLFFNMVYYSFHLDFLQRRFLIHLVKKLQILFTV